MLTMQRPMTVLLSSGLDKMNENFLDIMYVAKFSQVGVKSMRGASLILKTPTNES